MQPAFLQIVAGNRRGVSVPLDRERAVVIGRKRGVLLLDDPLVSSSHCEVSWQGSRFVLKDLGSTNGTMVDGKLIREAELRAGSEITVGSSRMILYIGEEKPEASKDVQPHPTPGQLEIAWLLDEELVEVRGAGGRGISADVIGQDLRLPPGLNAVVEVVAGQDAGKVFRFSRGNVSVGRRQGEVPFVGRRGEPASRSHRGLWTRNDLFA